MLTPRVIPSLLLSKGGLVKTQRFASPKYVGDPINAVRIFNDKEVDELMILDIDATREGRGPDFELIEQLAGECFMPLCYGGGIRSFDDARTLFGLGVEKVAIQSAFLEDPSVLRRIATRRRTGGRRVHRCREELARQAQGSGWRGREAKIQRLARSAAGSGRQWRWRSAAYEL